MKDSGRAALSPGQTAAHLDQLSDRCSQRGLWIVPVGGIEGFCPTAGGYGPKFAGTVLSEHDTETSVELEKPESLLKKIWKAVQE